MGVLLYFSKVQCHFHLFFVTIFIRRFFGCFSPRFISTLSSIVCEISSSSLLLYQIRRYIILSFMSILTMISRCWRGFLSSWIRIRWFYAFCLVRFFPLLPVYLCNVRLFLLRMEYFTFCFCFFFCWLKSLYWSYFVYFPYRYYDGSKWCSWATLLDRSAIKIWSPNVRVTRKVDMEFALQKNILFAIESERNKICGIVVRKWRLIYLL